MPAHILRKAVSLCIVFLLVGCASVIKGISDQPDGVIGAAQLSVSDDDMKKPEANKKEFLGRVVYDSEKKCQEFLNRLIVAQQSINTTGDVLTTIFSGVATAITPVNTIHALTATSTIISGTKTALNSNLYSKASSANLQSAIQQTYFKSINQYINDLSSASDSALVVSAEVSKIQTIHATCNIAAAETSIASTISPAKVAAPEPQSGQAASGSTTTTPQGSSPAPSVTPSRESASKTTGITRGVIPGSAILH